jgi:predicted lipoprotein with Yx(FWY)xxD motif
MKRLLALLAVSLLLVACGDDDDVATDDATTTTTVAEQEAEETTTTTAATTEDTAAPDGDAVVVAAEETSIGEVLTVEGMTVYLFTPDPPGGDSACADDCAGAWPPVFAEGEVTAGAGVDAALLGTAPRDDGPGDQVTYNGHRLYLFSGDAAPGDVNGNGVGDVWWAVTAAGEPVS